MLPAALPDSSVSIHDRCRLGSVRSVRNRHTEDDRRNRLLARRRSWRDLAGRREGGPASSLRRRCAWTRAICRARPVLHSRFTDCLWGLQNRGFRTIVRPKDRRPRPKRWADAVDQLRTLQAEYEAWRDQLPEALDIPAEGPPAACG